MMEKITQHIKDEISKISWEENGEWFISLGNCRLDFSQTYKLIGFTEKTVKLAWRNGDEWIYMQGRVEKRHDYYALYTDGWNYIEHLKLEKMKTNYTEAKEADERAWICPSCHQAVGIENYPSTSRKDSITEICSDCGLAEALDDFTNRKEVV